VLLDSDLEEKEETEEESKKTKFEKLLEDFKGNPEDYKHPEIDWGPPVGKEVW
jgi:antitoxin component of MazEF toxin-antitoxin module